MEPGYPPTKIARLADNSGIKTTSREGFTNLKMNGSTASEEAIEMNLEIGKDNVAATKSNGFNIFQFHELRLQHLIYNYIEAGLVVPTQLVLPIWKSVAFSINNDHSLNRHFPGLFGCCPMNVMDPEPGRCRRTDGKKWRCKRPVLAERKYCARHIHRGRNRSKTASVEKERVSQSTYNCNGDVPSSSTDLSISLQLNGNSNDASFYHPLRVGHSPTSVIREGSAQRSESSY